MYSSTGEYSLSATQTVLRCILCRYNIIISIANEYENATLFKRWIKLKNNKSVQRVFVELPCKCFLWRSLPSLSLSPSVVLLLWQRGAVFHYRIGWNLCSLCRALCVTRGTQRENTERPYLLHLKVRGRVGEQRYRNIILSVEKNMDVNLLKNAVCVCLCFFIYLFVCCMVMVCSLSCLFVYNNAERRCFALGHFQPPRRFGKQRDV